MKKRKRSTDVHRMFVQVRLYGEACGHKIGNAWRMSADHPEPNKESVDSRCSPVFYQRQDGGLTLTVTCSRCGAKPQKPWEQIQAKFDELDARGEYRASLIFVSPHRSGRLRLDSAFRAVALPVSAPQGRSGQCSLQRGAETANIEVCPNACNPISRAEARPHHYLRSRRLPRRLYPRRFAEQSRLVTSPDCDSDRVSSASTGGN